MTKSIDNELTVKEFRFKINNCLVNLKKEYKNLTNGRGSLPEMELCSITKQLTELYKTTKDKIYLQMKDNALIDYSNIVLRCNKDGSNYGKH
jgi:hypothetical protein